MLKQPPGSARSRDWHIASTGTGSIWDDTSDTRRSQANPDCVLRRTDCRDFNCLCTQLAVPTRNFQQVSV